MITILPTTEAHVEGFWETLDIVAREERYLGSTHAVPIAELLDFVKRGIEKDDPLFVALSGSDCVGWIDITRGKTPVKNHVGLLGMGLLPGWRGQGIGSRLIDAALMKSKAIGLMRIELQVYVDNAPAIALYRNFGFREEGVAKGLAYLRGKYIDALQMARLDEAKFVEKTTD